MTMHDKIMALEPIGCKSQVSALQFTNAKMRASQIAHEGDKLIEDLSAALSMYVKAGHGMSTDFCQQGDARQAALFALDEYRRWRDGE